MEMEDNKLLLHFSLFLKENRNTVLKRWYNLVTDNVIYISGIELDRFRHCFTTLVDSFIIYIPKGQFDEYYNSNRLVAKQLAECSISFEKFIKVFHLFEKSYTSLLLENFKVKEIDNYIIAIDELHHNTMAIAAEQYFNIKDSTVMALVKLTELRDCTTANHIERTRDYSILLSRECSLDDAFISNMSKASLLHDIGKVAIKDSILLKPDKLTEDEFNEMKKHTLIGAECISSIIPNNRSNDSYLTMARDIILYHHEKYDGSGYPYGLKGEDIPLSARIFAIADSYDAIVSERPYKKTLSHEEAVRRILLDSGKHFDPNIVKVFHMHNIEFASIKKRYSSLSA